MRAEAWGPGAAWSLEQLPELLGVEQDPVHFADLPRALSDTQRRHPGIRVGASRRAVETLVRAIPGQRVTGKAAGRSHRDLRRTFSQPAPGPRPELWLPPDPEALAAVGYAELHAMGLERTRASTLIEVCRRRNRIEALGEHPPEEAMRRLQTLRGIGPWTAQMFLIFNLGRPDVMPATDLGVQKGVQAVYRLRKLPEPAEVLRRTRHLAPYRSAASWYFWRAAETQLMA